MIRRAFQKALCFAGAALALVTIAIAEPPVDPAAEQPAFPLPPTAHLHDGFMMRLGWGPAHLYSRGHVVAPTPATSSGNPSPRPQPPGLGMVDLGIAANFAVGGAITPGIVLGVDFTSHMFADPEIEGQRSDVGGELGFGPPCCNLGIRLLSIGGFVLIYPNPKGGFSSGLTLSSMTAHEFSEGPSGWALAPQLGYDGWVGEQWSLGGFLRVTFARLDGESGGFGFQKVTYNAALTTLGVAITYQ